MKKKTKGADVALLINASKVALSTSCSVNVTVNTSDASTKDDTDPLFENVEPTTIAWDMSNESFIADRAGLVQLLQKWIAGEKISAEIQFKGTSDKLNGSAYISSLSASANNGENVKVSLSLTGDGKLTLTSI